MTSSSGLSSSAEEVKPVAVVVFIGGTVARRALSALAPVPKASFPEGRLFSPSLRPCDPGKSSWFTGYLGLEPLLHKLGFHGRVARVGEAVVELAGVIL